MGKLLEAVRTGSRQTGATLGAELFDYYDAHPDVRESFFGAMHDLSMLVASEAPKVCKDACTSKLDELRCRTDNPACDVAGPDRGAATAKQCLYPSEFLEFASCEKVPLRWRREVSLAVYLYPRLGELRVLPWEDVDLEHGSIHIHRALDGVSGKDKATKTGRPRPLNIEPNLLPLLRRCTGRAAARAWSARCRRRATWLAACAAGCTTLACDAPSSTSRRRRARR